MCWFKSTSACNKTSTKTVQMHKNKTLNRQNKSNMAGEKKCKISARAKTLNAEQT